VVHISWVKSDNDVANIQDALLRKATVRSFYMDETEITNSVPPIWNVKDSTMRVRLAILADEVGITAATIKVVKIRN
jgi:hypothetical protein